MVGLSVAGHEPSRYFPATCDPDTSQVGQMAMRQYDYHSYVPEAQELLELLREFDRIVEQGQ